MKIITTTKLFLFILIGFSLIGFVDASPPFLQPQQSTSINQIYIVHPLTQYYPQNRNISINFDVLNSSLKKLNPTNVNCTFILFNETGNIEIYSNLTYNTNILKWYNYYYTDDLGVHSYYVYCYSNQNEFGFVKENFETVLNGNQYSNNDTNGDKVLTIIIILFGVIFFYIFMVRNLNLTKETMDLKEFGLLGGLKLLIILTSFWIILIPLNFALYLVNTYINNILFTNTITAFYQGSIFINIFLTLYIFWWILLFVLRKVKFIS